MHPGYRDNSFEDIIKGTQEILDTWMSVFGFYPLILLENRTRARVMVHVVLCIVAMLLVAVAALRLGRPWKARSVSSFWW